MKHQKWIGHIFFAFSSVLAYSEEKAPMGIYVSPPKAFDSRTLTLQLEDLKRRLDTIRGLPVAAIQGALGNPSAYSLRERNFELQGTFGGSNKVSNTEKPSQSGLDISERVTTTPEASRATVPAATIPTAGLTAPAAAAPSLSAADRLIEVANLEYQINTLQSFLERSVTDRVFKGQPRLQALLGYRISISPPTGSHDRAAIVNLQVCPDTGQPALEVVALMPAQKSYNVFAIERKRNAFGGAAIVGAFTIGGSLTQRAETLYLYKASDTEAFSIGPARDAAKKETNPECVHFGWEFRPVLGRKSIEPGERQLMVLLSLPRADTKAPPTVQPFNLKSNAWVHWEKYDRNKGTLRKEVSEASRTQSHKDKMVAAPTSEDIQDWLAPQVESVSWEPIGKENFIAAFRGRGFFTGTKIAYASGVAQSPDSGLEVTSDTSMRVGGKLTDLLLGQPMLLGRYGGGNSIEARPEGIKAEDLPGGFQMLSVLNPVRRVGSQLVSLVVILTGIENRKYASQKTKVPALPGSGFIAAVDSTILGRPESIQSGTCQSFLGGSFTEPKADQQKSDDRHCLRIEYALPAEYFRKPSTLTVRYPFLGPNWIENLGLDPVSTTFEIFRLGQYDACDGAKEPDICKAERETKLRSQINALESREAAARKSLEGLENIQAETVESVISRAKKEAELAKTRVEIQQITSAYGLGRPMIGERQTRDISEIGRIIADAEKAIGTYQAALKDTDKDRAQKEIAPAVSALKQSKEKPIEPPEDVLLAIRGPGSPKCWTVIVGGQQLGPTESPLQLRKIHSTVLISIGSKYLKNVDYVLVDPGELVEKKAAPTSDQAGSATVKGLSAPTGPHAAGATSTSETSCQSAAANPEILKIPKEKPEPEKPKTPVFAEGTKLTAKKNSAPLVSIKGTNLNQIKYVRFGDRLLGIIPDEKGTELKLVLSREVTSEIGTATLICDLADGKSLPLEVQIVKSE